MTDTFGCGHARTPENSYQRYNVTKSGEKHFYPGCLTCRQERSARGKEAARLEREARKNTYAAARMRCPSHDGKTANVREALRVLGQPSSVYALQLATGMDADPIRRVLRAMLESGGITTSIGPKGITFYELYKPPQKVAEPAPGEEFKWPTKITYPNYRWGSSRLG